MQRRRAYSSPLGIVVGSLPRLRLCIVWSVRSRRCSVEVVPSAAARRRVRRQSGDLSYCSPSIADGVPAQRYHIMRGRSRATNRANVPLKSATRRLGQPAALASRKSATVASVPGDRSGARADTLANLGRRAGSIISRLFCLVPGERIEPPTNGLQINGSNKSPRAAVFSAMY